MRVQPTLPPRYLRTPDAANFVGLSIRTLEKHRSCVRLSTGDGGGIPMPADPRAYIIRLQARARKAQRSAGR